MAARGPKMAAGVWKQVQSLVIGRCDLLLQNKSFDPSTPSLRKGDDRGENGKKTIMKIGATNIVARRPPTDWKADRSCQKFSTFFNSSIHADYESYLYSVP